MMTVGGHGFRYAGRAAYTVAGYAEGMNVTRASYEYRSIKVSIWDKHRVDDHRRRGQVADRALTISEPNPDVGDMRITDKDGDDRNAFELRAFAALMGYFNMLGSEGWRLQEFTVDNRAYSHSWPEGVHFFVREIG